MFNYQMTKLRNASREYDGLWFPKALHPITVTTEELLKEIPKSCSLKRSDLLAALTELSEFLLRHLRQGEVVDIDGIGRFKLEVKGQGVISPDDFDEQTDVSGYVCHFTPYSRNGRKPLFEDIELVREE
jgi:predicted histone-like DNA-binding protein